MIEGSARPGHQGDAERHDPDHDQRQAGRHEPAQLPQGIEDSGQIKAEKAAVRDRVVPDPTTTQPGKSGHQQKADDRHEAHAEKS